MRIGVIGLNHKSATLEIREALSRIRLPLDFAAVPLITCNRFEIYFSAEDLATQHEILLAYLREHIPFEFEHALYAYFKRDCFVHLIGVTCGLDSAIIGESDIQHQVKRAYELARINRRLSHPLHYLFQKGLKLSKMIRSAFFFPRAKNTLVDRVIDRIPLDAKKALLVGNSSLNRSFIHPLKGKGIEMTVASHHSGNWDEVQRWTSYDVVIAATYENQWVIKGEGRGTVVFDLSVPRVVDPQVGKSVLLYNLDQLTLQGGERGQERESHLFIEGLVDRQIALFFRHLRPYIGEAKSRLAWAHGETR